MSFDKIIEKYVENQKKLQEILFNNHFHYKIVENKELLKTLTEDKKYIIIGNHPKEKDRQKNSICNSTKCTKLIRMLRNFEIYNKESIKLKKTNIYSTNIETFSDFENFNEKLKKPYKTIQTLYDILKAEINNNLKLIEKLQKKYNNKLNIMIFGYKRNTLNKTFYTKLNKYIETNRIDINKILLYKMPNNNYEEFKHKGLLKNKKEIIKTGVLNRKYLDAYKEKNKETPFK